MGAGRVFLLPPSPRPGIVLIFVVLIFVVLIFRGFGTKISHGGC